MKLVEVGDAPDTCNAVKAGEKCKKLAMIGSTKCRMHGGASPSGVYAARFTSGKYSKILPKRLLSNYLIAREDAELISHREEIALLDARILDLLNRVDSGESGQRWRELRDLISGDFYTAVMSGDPVEVQAAYDSVRKAVNRAVTDYRAWTEIHNVLNQRKSLAEAERKRLVDLRQMITAEQAVVLISAIVTTVQQYEKDDRIIDAIHTEIARIIDNTKENGNNVYLGATHPELVRELVNKPRYRSDQDESIGDEWQGDSSDNDTDETD